MVLVQALVVTVFVLVHLFAGKLRFLEGIPRSRWLSMAGGISVAYVFIHLFPELAEAQQELGAEWAPAVWFEHHAYLIALGGLALFYGLHRLVKVSQHRQGESRGSDEGETGATPGVFWLHIASFAIYNALIGYLLVHREDQDAHGLFFYSVAMAVHFIVTDYGLRQDHKNTYRRVGRWVLSAAILLGWGGGLATRVSATAVHVLFAFLAGGIVLNVLKEELPEERQSRFFPFALGTGVYAFLLLL